ncbi:hypothetical protein RHMOL_Rhmol10G0172600 [Rhododendron molle]|uniref:Uncharacterized protein n=1 Tax=Rhododendron molle TaxID=49168 RepID=A0ACC0M508_RHOML|nr:hypothetical protein RHMOL_Rhmol10G0172600 [Rhododendron molle]
MATVSKCWSLPTISSSPSDLRRANRLQITMFVAPASFATTMVFCIGAFSNGRMRRDKKMVKVREEEMKHRLFPRAMCNSQRIYCCFGLKMEARANSNLAKTSLVAGFATGWSKTQSLYIRQPANCHSSPLGALLTSKTQDISSKPFTGDEEIGVLLLNLGGPETLDDVQPFLFNLFADPDIIRLPRLFRFLQKPLAQLISVLRAPKSKEGYASIGGGSPLRRITDAQAR